MLDHLYEANSSTTTRRRVVKTGAKIAYAAPLVAASMHLSRSSGLAVSPVGGDVCAHSIGINGGCMGACAAAGCTGNVCNDICGNGQNPGACPPGTGDDNPCCNAGYCVPSNYTCPAGTYTGPTC